MSIDTLIVSQALIQHQDEVSLHPDVFLWEKELTARSKDWFQCTAKSPLDWYAALLDFAPAALIAARLSVVDESYKQLWVVTPYHARLMRDSVYVMAEGEFPWTAEDVESLCGLLNPWLQEEGMQLLHVGAALLLASQDIWQVNPQGFAQISGGKLPAHHHAGADGGRLNRLLSEIQMLLHQQPLPARRQRREADVTGIWLWGGCACPTASSNAPQTCPLATRNPALQSLADAKDARLMITEAERWHTLANRNNAIPKRVILAGDGVAVLLTRGLLPSWGKTKWTAKSMKDEVQLLSLLRGWHAA
ncbi:MAG: threonine synthase [Zetaproteobacteria bacterium CG_4_9_14_3_um_filter_49_83]|nr:MAG: threonine synthase [Zetaproteobacteria bacterium CG1_02_49_23]PIQ34134.1 MAG: threonine synthase [Zetaproteobacteria bacterium CG17_big_fil_post_rev_8_21_14_2_50_50_13]PIV29318.1 MAG: threonine synthase [Zetaproteobacteria bacterium CG02_land_8_20_14_3_00_50_9]PIY56268.1 MAG: threonine synthase [Zetaproteobacteria bacterium CG_4_10_14_0_8_um_filter_49_80]PJA34796.1 MAG: threonine synthase [Zetaproteobacteria bacterium CG_4_9_14_3_um_filter_49_83]